MDIIIIETGDISFNELKPYMRHLSAQRQAAVMKKKSDDDRVLSLVSKLLLLSEISRRTDIPRGKIKIRRGKFGKPYLKEGGLMFSLSHTKGAVCVAFSEQEVGIDIERRGRSVNERLYRRVLSEEECAAVQCPEDFLRLWVQKEAFLKRVGVGVTVDLRGVETHKLPSTAVKTAQDYLIGASGDGAEAANAEFIGLFELLNLYK